MPEGVRFRRSYKLNEMRTSIQLLPTVSFVTTVIQNYDCMESTVQIFI